MTFRANGIHHYAVPIDVFTEIYNVGGGRFKEQSQSGWRKFYAKLEGFKVVTRSNRVNKRSLNITGKHCKAKGKSWCPASFNFITSLPIDCNAVEVVFELTIVNLDQCSCGAEAYDEPQSNPLSFDDENSIDTGMGSSISSVNHLDIASRRDKFTEIVTNRPVSPVEFKRNAGFSRDPCKCEATDDQPCGRFSSCIHVKCSEECDPSSCPAGDACQNQKLTRREFVPLQIIYTPDRGCGVACKIQVAPETVVTEYIGELINNNEVKYRKQLPGRKDYYLFKITDDLYIDAERAGSLARYINHSCEPNCRSEKINVGGNTRIAIISNETIEAGTEITFDYMWELDDSGDEMPCLCGSSKCSGTIQRRLPKQL